MKRISLLIPFSVLLVVAFNSCDALKFPTNTTGSVFSLNGNWQLDSSNDANAMRGTSITVLPVVGEGTVKLLQNNTYCLRTGDAMWKEIKSSQTSVFTINNLVSACTGSPVYKSASVTVINNDQVKLTGQTVSGKDLVQLWKRLTK